LFFWGRPFSPPPPTSFQVVVKPSRGISHLAPVVAAEREQLDPA